MMIVYSVYCVPCRKLVDFILKSVFRVTMLNPRVLSCCLLIVHLCSTNAFERNNKFEGQNCRTMQNEAGVCKTVEECHQYIDELKIAYGPIEAFNNVMHCNFFKKQPIICCKRYDMASRNFDTKDEPIPLKSKSAIACESFKEIRNNFGARAEKQEFTFNVFGGKVNLIFI